MGDVGVAAGEGEDCVQMIREDNDGVDGEWVFGAGGAEGGAQGVDVGGQVGGGAIGEGDGEEGAAAGDGVAAVEDDLGGPFSEWMSDCTS